MTALGFLLIDKAPDWTSHDVVAKARRITGVRKIGHAGTLDPMATGLVVLGIGRATKLLRFVQDLPKEYTALVQLGVATDSLDADGAEVWRAPMEVEQNDLEDVLPEFIGEIMQVPPMVSALKQGGRRLHELAREGVEVERPARPVRVLELELTSFESGEYPVAGIRVRCGKGTYVRSLADDIARRLGGRGHLVALRRVANGSLHVADSVEIGVLEAAGDRWDDFVLSPGQALADLDAHPIDGATARAVSNGVRLPRPPGSTEGCLLRMMEGEQLVAVYRVGAEDLRAEVVLA